MKIIFFIRDLKIEGVQVVTLRLAKLLLDRGVEVEILTLHPDIHLDVPKNIVVKSLSFSSENKEKDRFSLFYAWYESNKFDYLIASHGECIKVISKVDDNRLIPYFHNSDEYSYNRRGMFRRYKYRRRLRKQLNNKRALCVSEGIKSFMIKCMKEEKIDISVLYNPIDIDDIRRKSKEYTFTFDGGGFLLYTGRLEPQKRVDRLIDSFNLIKNNKINLLILGEGSLERELKYQVKKLGIEARVKFKKFVKNPYPIMSAAKGLLLTSDHEGLPTVLIESLSLGVPVISVDCPTGPSEILTGDLECFLVSSKNEKEIASRIDWLLAADSLPSLAEGYEKFTEDKIYQKFRDIFLTQN